MNLRDRWRYSPTNTRFWNWRNRRAIVRGRRDVAARAGDAVRSGTPVLRNRVNPATGRPHRDDRQIGRLSDRALSRHPEIARRTEQRNRAARSALGYTWRTQGRSR